MNPDDRAEASALAVVAGWLRCPVCGGGVELSGRMLGCVDRHSFDVAKQGYVNLLGRAAPKNADTPAMVAARDRFLSAGFYSPIVDTLAPLLADAQRVVEVGAGTGYYLSNALASNAFGLATDVSVAAARRSARAHPRVASVVADTWEGLPLKDDSVDLVLCVFAPRNMQEFRRVLAPGGRVVFVVPNEEHLASVRESYGLLDVQEGKAEALSSSLRDTCIKRVRFPLVLSAAAARDLVGMGPNAFHSHAPVHEIATEVDVSIVTGAF